MKHTHHLALRVIPRPPLQEVWCPGCGEAMYTVEPASEIEVAVLEGALVIYGGKVKRKRARERGK